MKAIEQHFTVVLFILLYKLVLAFACLKYDRLNESFHYGTLLL